MEDKTIRQTRSDAQHAQTAEKSSTETLQEQAHNLRYMCPDGTLVRHPSECGDQSFLPKLEMKVS